MLHGVYAPSDFESFNKDPTLSAGEKLEIISLSPIRAKPSTYGTSSWVFELPFVRGASMAVPRRAYEDENLPLYAFMIDVGDRELYGNGIGSRLIKGAVRFALTENPGVKRFATGWARLGIVNAAVSVFGEENVAVSKDGQHYGWQYDRPLGQVLDDFPATEGECYLVNSIQANIDPVQAYAWEMPASISSTSE